ncbi:hypothetical protein QQP08_018382 [Theobroma cacao]|nr:hypothetical protein QQP08_018382 [Theobroma cacao]
MGFASDQNAKVDSTLSFDSCKKKNKRDGLSVVDTFKLWSQNVEAKQSHKTPTKGLKKGQKTSGKKLLLSTFPTTCEATLAYDKADKIMYGEKAILNMDSDLVVTTSHIFMETNTCAASNSMTLLSN